MIQWYYNVSCFHILSNVKNWSKVQRRRINPTFVRKIVWIWLILVFLWKISDIFCTSVTFCVSFNTIEQRVWYKFHLKMFVIIRNSLESRFFHILRFCERGNFWLSLFPPRSYFKVFERDSSAHVNQQTFKFLKLIHMRPRITFV